MSSVSSGVKAKELGTLVVVVLKAQNLPDKHTFTKQDPFVTIELGSSKASTDIDKRGGQHPVWDKDLHIKVLASETKLNRTLKVLCYAKEPKGDDLIGSGEVDITETLRKPVPEFDDWVKLYDNGTQRGEVYLEMTFFPSGPRPLVRRPSKLPPNERLARPPQTPPKDYNRLANGSPTRTNLTTIKPSSHSPSPKLRNDSPLPPIPDEIPTPLLASKGRVPASLPGAPQNDPPVEVSVPLSLRPGGPSRPNRHQHTPSLPSVAHAPVVEPRPQSVGDNHYSPVYKQPSLPGTPNPQVQPTFVIPHITHQPSYPVPGGYDNYDPQPLDRPVHYDTGPKPAPSPIDTDLTIPFAFPEPHISPHISPLPALNHNHPAPYHIQPSPFQNYSTPPPSHGRNSVQLQENHVDAREQERLSARYNTPLPLPPGAESQAHTHAHRARTSSQTLSPYQEPPISHPSLPSTSVASPLVASPPSATQSIDQGSPRQSYRSHSPSPPRSARTPIPDSYLERERLALSRARQQEEDEELARRLAAELELEVEPTPEYPRASTSSEKKPMEKELSQEEKDAEYARRLAWELNEDLVKAEREKAAHRGSSASENMPGSWHS